jgi:hypothetical protein
MCLSGSLLRGVLDELPRKWALTASVAQLSSLRDELGNILFLEGLESKGRLTL